MMPPAPSPKPTSCGRVIRSRSTMAASRTVTPGKIPTSAAATPIESTRCGVNVPDMAERIEQAGGHRERDASLQTKRYGDGLSLCPVRAGRL